MSETNSSGNIVKTFLIIASLALNIVFLSALLIEILRPAPTSLSRRSWCIENCAPDLVFQWSPASNLGCMCAGEPLVLEQTE